MRIDEAAGLLAGAGIDAARAEAEILAAHVSGLSRGELRTRILGGGPEVPDERAPAYAALVERRAARVPLQHLTGLAPFRHIEAAVGPGVFVPRPETELIVDLVAELTGLSPRAPGLPLPSVVGRRTVVDLCSGSAALTVSLALEFPGTDAHGVEVSPAALEWAGRTVGRYEDSLRSAASAVTLHAGDVRSPLPSLGPADVVVSNPPYVPPDATPIDPEVARHDPSLALYGGGPDGLELPAAVVARAAELLVPGGWFVCEHAEAQGPGMRRLLAAGGKFDLIDTRKDLASRPRFTIGKAAHH